eukprot:g7761.t1
METVLSAAQRGCSRVTLARCKRAYPQNIRPWSSTRAAHAYVPTHDVVNQVTPLENFNSALDTALLEAMERSGCEEGAVADVKAFGEKSGKREWLEKAHHANKHPPQLVTHDRFGNRVDCVEYQPTYHELMDHGLSHGVAAYAWQNLGAAGAHVARGAMCHLMYQLESGTVCPMTMTFASVPALRMGSPDRCSLWINRVASGVYDPRDIPIEAKKGATIGMSMTEKQGGSDVRANSTVATPVSAQKSGNGDMFSLVGHKWFTSAPMSDAFLTLAQTDEHPNSPSCFLVPRWLPDGSRNKGFNIMRLKDKIGDRSNASSEVEYNDAYGFMIGEPGRGVPTIIEMVVHTRLDCTIGSAALMRHAAQQAAHHTSERKAFGAYLIDQPVMRSVLADLAVESEAAIATWVRMAQAFDAGASASQDEQLFRRIATAVSKYWVCKRAPAMVFESLECFGGNGYVEEGPMARLFRQSPLNSIWEGSGNVISLDIVRALQKEEVGHAMVNELEKARGYDKHLDSLLDNVKDNIFKPMEVGPRYLADQLALALQANILLRDGNPKVAEAFCALRLRPDQRGWNVGAWGSNTLGEEHISVCIDRLRL